MTIESQTEYQGQWEERWHPLREEWIMMAAHRQNRPWNGDTTEHAHPDLPDYDPTCYLCPGNTRVSGACNDNYTSTFVFDNDHPSVGLHAPTELAKPPGIYRNRPATGIARVVCYSPQHNLTLSQLTPAGVENLVATWQRQFTELAAHPAVNCIIMFENRGEVVGVSNPHPHGQIYATNFVFRNIETHVNAGTRHLRETGRVLFQDILAAEYEDSMHVNSTRIICENATACAFIPYFGRYAYEVYIAPRRTHANITTMSDAEVCDFAQLLRQITIKFDNLWQMSFPYMLMLHQAPTDGGNYGGFHFHVEFYPPLRKPNLLKYLGTPETGAGSFLCDTVPREKAAELRALPDIHYKQR